MEKIRKFITSGLMLAILPGIFFLNGCASTGGMSEEDKALLLAGRQKIFAHTKFVIVPATALLEHITSTDDEIDSYLKGNGELFQLEIAAYLRTKLAEKGIKAEVIEASSAEFNAKLDGVLKKMNRKGFFNPNTGEFDREGASQVMSAIAKEYDAALIAPLVQIKAVPFSTSSASSAAAGPFVLITLVVDAASKAKVGWDGVERPIESGGGKLGRMFGGGKEGQIDVLSLHLELLDSEKLHLVGDGGINVRSKVGATSFIKQKPEDIFNNKEYIKEAVKVAIDEPLFADF